ncbi:MAG TPA: discoidin domain-containing protein, partial [Spirochaetota bacterium]|nr:discoidin domain-containing protein [Spirochaetota bacterium]
MNTVNILASAYYKGAIHSVSSASGDNKADNVLNDDIESFWCTNKSHSATGEYIVIDYGVAVAVNVIELLPSPSGKTTFPSDFRLESSADGSNWEVIKTENRYSLDEDRYRLLLPMNAFQFLKLYIIKPKRIAAKYFSEIGGIKVGIQGASAITASSCSSYEHDPSNLLMNDSAKYWESETSNTPSRQWIEIDMGRDFPLAHIGLISTSSAELFPEQLSIESSEDRKIWTTIAELKRFKAEANRSYIFGMYQFSARYIRILCTTVQSSKQNYCAQIAQICAYASLPSDSHFHVNAAVQYATIFQPGIVTLAGNGDTTPATVVQANDSRLRDASTIFKGIVQMAPDGSSEKGLVVQASDSRLSPATELKYGIVRLAYDREMVEGVAVQSIDSRLKEATENSFGIVKLCPDGEYVENSVLKGNDSRIQKATEKNFGIVRLADDGEDSEFSVVQGNDRRLKDATIVARGIVELAEDGEDKEGVAVQGNDRRLKDATVHSKGIVELAEDGEDKEGVAVQGNDRRLKDATVHSKGIVEL